jgi:hypothetical protein
LRGESRAGELGPGAAFRESDTDLTRLDLAPAPFAAAAPVGATIGSPIWGGAPAPHPSGKLS